MIVEMMNELTTHLWQSTGFAAAAGLLTLAFRKNRAKVRFWLWLTASLKFFVPFALLIGLGSHLGWKPAAPAIATPAVTFAVEYVAEPFSGTASTASLPAAAPRSTDWMPIVILCVWGCGFLAIALIRLRLWQRIREALRESARLEIPAAVEIRSSPDLLEPGVVGLLDPVLLLPDGIVERLTPLQLEAVLAHELCHVRRRDNLFASIHMIVEAIFWFHPLVWWIGARLVEERERACDEDVLNLGNQPRVYADAILNVCKLYTESPLVCVSGVTGSDIKRRIEAIMTNRKGLTLNRAKKILLASAGFVALAVPVMIGVVIGIGRVPAIHAQSQTVIPPVAQIAQVAQVTSPAPANAPAPAATPLGAPLIKYQDRRLVAMLFDFSTMTSDEQLREQKTAVEFIQNNLKPADLVCIMMANTGPLTIAQDFTDDKDALQAAVRQFHIGEGTGNSSAPGVDAKLATIATAAKMLAGFPEKKALMYFSSGITQSGADNQAQLLELINTAKKANVAIYPIDARGMTASAPDSDTNAAPGRIGGIVGDVAAAASGGGGRGRGRGGSAPAQPEGVSQDEYNRRVAYAQTKFGSTNSAMGRAYIRYGAPDQIEDRSSSTQNPSQIWRYNYLEDFQSSAAFEFTGNGSFPLGVHMVYPPPVATYEGKAGGGTALAEALSREAQGQSAPVPSVIAGLPGRHASMQIYPVSVGWAPAADRRYPTLTVPLDSLSGQVDIVAQIQNPQHAAVGMLRDSAQAAAGTYQATFTLPPGSYVCNVLVREQVTGKLYGETIDFDVK